MDNCSFISNAYETPNFYFYICDRYICCETARYFVLQFLLLSVWHCIYFLGQGKVCSFFVKDFARIKHCCARPCTKSLLLLVDCTCLVQYLCIHRCYVKHVVEHNNSPSVGPSTHHIHTYTLAYFVNARKQINK